MGKKKAPAPEEPQAPAGQQQGNGSGRKPPVHEVRCGRIRAVVWANDGKEGRWYSVNVTRSYRDGEGAWKQATSYGRDDLLVVAEVARLCFLWIAQQNGTHAPAAETTNGASEEPIPI